MMLCYQHDSRKQESNFLLVYQNFSFSFFLTKINDEHTIFPMKKFKRDGRENNGNNCIPKMTFPCQNDNRMQKS